MYMNTKIYVYYVQFNHVGVKDLTFVVTAKMSSRTLVLFCTRSFFYCLKSCFNKSKNICIITYRVELSHRMTKNGLYLCSWVLHFVDFSRSFLKILKISGLEKKLALALDSRRFGCGGDRVIVKEKKEEEDSLHHLIIIIITTSEHDYDDEYVIYSQQLRKYLPSYKHTPLTV